VSSGDKSKPNRKPVLTANVPQILAELHQLAAANACKPLAESRSSGSIATELVIRGK
jgi:hypothetical protein